jgi:hypothetical protein
MAYWELQLIATTQNYKSIIPLIPNPGKDTNLKHEIEFYRIYIAFAP